jgi:hypothetical protein
MITLPPRPPWYRPVVIAIWRRTWFGVWLLLRMARIIETARGAHRRNVLRRGGEW